MKNWNLDLNKNFLMSEKMEVESNLFKKENKNIDALKEINLIYLDDFDVEFEKSKSKIILNFIEEYYGLEIRNKNASLLVLQDLFYRARKEHLNKNNKYSENTQSLINKWGLDQWKQLALLSLSHTDPLYSQMFVKGEITQEEHDLLNSAKNQLIEILKNNYMLNLDISNYINPDISFINDLGINNPGNLIDIVEVLRINETIDNPDMKLNITTDFNKNINNEELELVETKLFKSPYRNYVKELKKLKKNNIFQNKNEHLRKLITDKLEFDTGLENLELLPNYISNLEADPSLLKDVHVFDQLFGLDKVELLLKKTGITMSPKLSYFMKNINFIGEKDSMELNNLPDFHFEMQEQYENNFWNYGKLY